MTADTTHRRGRRWRIVLTERDRQSSRLRGSIAKNKAKRDDAETAAFALLSSSSRIFQYGISACRRDCEYAE